MNLPATKTLQSLSTVLLALAGLGATATAAAARPKSPITPIHNPVTFKIEPPKPVRSVRPARAATKTVTAESIAALPGADASTNATTLLEAPEQLDTEGEVAQATRQRRRRTVRRGKPDENYLGVGINIGLDGETALGESETLTVFGRVKLARRFSLRPSVIIDDAAVISFPATYDIPLSGRDRERLLPEAPVEFFIGAGPLFTLDDDDSNEVGVAGLTGVDVPFARRFTVSTNLIVGFSDDEVNLGGVVGVAFRFPRR